MHEAALAEGSTEPYTQVATWRDRNFRRLWAAMSGTLLGSQITALAIPLIAAVQLDASPLQMGWLAALNQGAYLLVSLPSGLILDRVRRRPVIVATDVACAVLLLSIPCAALLDAIRFWHLCVVVAGVGTLSAIGEIAHMAYVPSLIAREHLVHANSRIQVSHSVAESAGPGIGGILVDIVSAPFAIIVDSLSFLMSAVLLRSIDVPEPLPGTLDPGQSARHALAEGFRSLLRHHVLRSIVLTSMGSALFQGGLIALYILFAVRELQLDAMTIGLIFTLGGVCAVPGAMVADWTARKIGIGPAIVVGWLIEASAMLMIPFAAGPPVAVVAVLGLSKAIANVTGTVANIHQWTLRQTITPDNLQGRVTATHRFLVYGVEAIGAVAGGLLASGVNLRNAILICAIGMVLSRLPVLFSGLRDVRMLPLVGRG